MSNWDVMIIGLGGIGSAVCAELARRGVRVLGIDRWQPPHDQGSSHGATRIIRRAYFEHPDYVPLVDRAFDLWMELEQQTGRTLFTRCGLVQFGPADGTVLPGVRASVERHRLEAESWTAEQARRQFPQFSVPDEWSAVWEPGAGFLAVEACVEAHLEVATRHGAELQLDTFVHSLSPRNAHAGVTAQTDRGDFSAGTAIVAPGPWAPQLLGDTGVSLQVLRKHLHWFKAPRAFAVDEGFPTFLVETDDGVFYGFGAIDQRGLKVAEHTGGERIADPVAAPRDVDRVDFARVRRFVESVFPTCSTDATAHAVCFYTMTADEHFVVDRHPRCDNTWIAAGFSGHGFKFAPVIGQALADLATEGRTDLPVAFLRLGRASL